MRICVILAALTLASPAAAQLVNPGTSVDTSQFATKDDVQAVQSTASTAQTQSSSALQQAQAAVSAAVGSVKSVNTVTPDTNGAVSIPVPTTSSIASQISTATTGLATTSAVSAVQAAIPPVCTAKPASDTYAGTVGSLTPCTPPMDATRATQVQTTTATTSSDGTFTGSFIVPFATAPSYAHAEINSNTTPFVCQISTVTASTYSGKCFQVVSTTLPGVATSLLNLVVNPIAAATAGQSVKIIARQ